MLRTALLLLVLIPLSAAAQTVRIAAAANLIHVLPVLNAAFAEAAPDAKITVAFGASGSLVAQITHGAPYDVFLSADMDYPRALIRTGHADAASLMPFAEGRLVLWTARKDLSRHRLNEALLDPAVHKIALAHPVLAPYGRAARQYLLRHQLWDPVSPRLVVGENISQTAQFVSTGHAELGFVALSLVLAMPPTERGHWWEIAAGDHEPLLQGAILTLAGAANPAAQRYLDFLRSPAARAVLEKAGYRIPVETTAAP